MNELLFTDDEIAIIREAARIVWDRMVEHFGDEAVVEETPEDIWPEDVIHMVAHDRDVEDLLEDQGHGDLAERFSGLEPEEVINLLLPEFNIQ